MFCNYIQQVKGYPGANGSSDHVPIVATLRLKLKKLHQKKTVDTLQVDLLHTHDKYKIITSSASTRARITIAQSVGRSL